MNLNTCRVLSRLSVWLSFQRTAKYVLWNSDDEANIELNEVSTHRRTNT